MSKKNLEAALFVSKEPTTIEQFAEILEEDKSVIVRWMYELINEYADRGMNIKQVGGGFEMVTAPDCFDTIAKIVPKEIESLPPAALETVSIVAYKQPVIRADIARLRNVQNPDHGISLSIEKGLIREIEKGFVTTDLFLKFFGINDLHELPEIVVETDFSENSEGGNGLQEDIVSNEEIETAGFEMVEDKPDDVNLDKDALDILDNYVHQDDASIRSSN